MKRKFLNIPIALFVIFFVISTNSLLFAQNTSNDFKVNKLTDRFDNTLLKTNLNSFTKPKRLILAPLPYTYTSSSKFGESIFFYFVDKLGFPQSPIQYTIDHTGKISKHTNIDDDFTEDIVIGIDSKVLALSSDQIDAVFQLIDKYEISKENILLRSVKLRDDKKALVYSEIKERPQLETAISILSSKPRTNKILKLENVEINFAKEMDPGINSEVSVYFKNVSGFTMYKDETSKIFLRTVGNKDSELFINDKWLSPSKTGELVETRIPNDQKGTIKFQVLSPLIKGSFEQEFEITNSKNDKLSNGIKLLSQVKDVGQKVIQVGDTGFGFLNIRKDPQFSSSIIGTVNTGEKHVYTEEKNGYVKIKIPSKNIDGWIQLQFTKKL